MNKGFVNLALIGIVTLVFFGMAYFSGQDSNQVDEDFGARTRVRVSQGGTGQTQFPVNMVLTTGTSTFNPLQASSSPSFSVLIATSTTATSTFAGGLTIETSGFVYDFSTNHVGIGTAVPDGTLHIFSGNAGSVTAQAAADDLVIENSAAGGLSILVSNNNTASMYFGSPATDPRDGRIVYNTNTRAFTVITAGSVALTVDSSQNLGIGTTTPGAVLGVTNTGTGLSFAVEDTASNDATPFVIDASGQVGIGTAVPLGKLHVVEGAGTVPTLDAGELFIFQNNDDTSDRARLLILAGTNAFSILNFGDSGNNAQGSFQYNHTDDELQIKTNNSTKMTITSSGNIGIGTTSPAALLHLRKDSSGAIGPEIRLANAEGAAETKAAIGFYSGGGNTERGRLTFNVQQGGSGELLWSKGSGGGLTDVFIIDGSGRVGIGTTTPAGVFSVTNAGTRPTVYIADKTDPDSTPFVIDASGNVGIGTASPSELLDIVSLSASADGISITNSDGLGGSIKADNSTLYFNSTDGNNVFRLSNGKIRFGAAGTNGAIELGSGGSMSENGNGGGLSFNDTEAKLSNGLIVTGNVGIGTTTPAALLSVTNDGTGPTVWISDTSDPDSTPFVIDASGLVGIGTGAPTQPLHVIGNIFSSNIIISSRSGNSTFAHASDNNAGLGFTGAAGSNTADAHLYTSAIARLTVDVLGNIGIGTTTPDYLLSVDSGSTATTSVNIGDISVIGTEDSPGCIQMATSNGNWSRIYFPTAGNIIHEAGRCDEGGTE